MKRVITLLMAAVMVIGAASMASAVEFKASGHMDILFGLEDNAVSADDADTIIGGFNKERDEDNFFAGQLFRPKLTMKAEGVTAVFEAQQHQSYWGSDWPVGGNPDVSIRIRQAYIDFKLPGTPVSLKMGYQQLTLPAIWGHPVFEARVGAVLASVPLTDQIGFSAFYARPANDISGSDAAHNSTDMFGLLLPMDFGMVKATPYFVYAKVGNNDATPAILPTDSWNDTLMVGGANINIMPMDALSVKLDAIVTNHKTDGPRNTPEMKTGWMIATAIDYEMPFGTPGLFAWYATGADDDNEGGLASVQADGFCPTSLGYEGYSTWGHGAWVGNRGSGSMGVGLQVADMSFIDSLKHTIRVAYIKGTADKDSALIGYDQLSEEWSFIEVNLDSNWAIYENLSAAVDMGLLIPDLDDTYTNGGGGKANGQDDMAWRTQVRFRFSF